MNEPKEQRSFGLCRVTHRASAGEDTGSVQTHIDIDHVKVPNRGTDDAITHLSSVRSDVNGRERAPDGDNT